jgi:hypothetical protein
MAVFRVDDGLLTGCNLSEPAVGAARRERTFDVADQSKLHFPAFRNAAGPDLGTREFVRDGDRAAIRGIDPLPVPLPRPTLRAVHARPCFWYKMPA